MECDDPKGHHLFSYSFRAAEALKISFLVTSICVHSPGA